MTDRCEPAPAADRDTLHVLYAPYEGGLIVARWGGGLGWHRIAHSHYFSPKTLAEAGWRYVRPLDLSVEAQTAEAKAVLDAAVGYRDNERLRPDGLYSLVPLRSFMDAVDAYRPYVPPDPVNTTLAALRASIGEGSLHRLETAAMEYLAALDAKDKTDG